MRVFQINICPNLSTGNIMMGIADIVRINGNECMTASAPKNSFIGNNHYIIGTNLERKFNICFGKVIGCEYKLSTIGTRALIKEIQKFQPDIIHFHNLHSYYVNLNILIDYIRTTQIKVVWTFHDCWPITGHCPHFLISGCDKWQTQCIECTQYKKYPYSYFDNSYKKYQEKKHLFRSINNLTVVTPSFWLQGIVKRSFLSDRRIEVISNGIDLNIFRPASSDRVKAIKKKRRANFALLGVASEWDERKGLDIFVKLFEFLDSQYVIILVGTNEKIDKILPEGIVSIHHTENVDELVELYSGVDVFLNPTREDTYPTVNMEALACGTPVITFATGGSPEILDETCGSVVPIDDIDALEAEIVRVCTQQPYSNEACLKRAQKFDMNDRFEEYVKLYEELR